jgi:hypothetical protein
MSSPTLLDSPITRFMELFPPLRSTPPLTRGEFDLSPCLSPTPQPPNSDEEFKNTQRDCAIFPAFTDYLYGPDTRQQPSPSSYALQPQPHFMPQVSVYRRNWMPPEELAYLQLNQRASYQAMVTRRMERSPQLSSTTSDTSSDSPTSAERAAVSAVSVRLPRAITPSQSTGVSLSDSTGGVPAVQPQCAPKDLVSPNPQFEYTAQQTYPTPQATQQGTNFLVPGQILTMGCRGFSDFDIQNINTRVTMCWSTIRALEAPQDKKQQAIEYLTNVTNHVHTQHNNWMVRDGIRNLWRCFITTRELPPQDPRHMEAKEYIISSRQNLNAGAALRIEQALNAMAQAEREGREPLDEVEKYANFTPAAALPPRLEVPSPGRHPIFSSSFPFPAVLCGQPPAVRPLGPYHSLVPPGQHPAAIPSARYTAMASSGYTAIAPSGYTAIAPSGQ